MKHIFCTTLLGTLISTAALAGEYDQIVSEQSSITFGYSQMGVKLQGHFTRFDGSLTFDSAHPEQASASIEVALDSISTGLAEADAEVSKPGWFNIAAFPVARFESHSVTVLAEGLYEIVGSLSIKGHTEEVVFPARFSSSDGVGRFAGELNIRRGDFAIGEGSWARFNILANEVTVYFSIAATSH